MITPHGPIDSSEIADGSIDTADLADDAVTNAKLANISRGSVKVGGASDAPTDLDAKTSGQILVGDGTDIVSVAVSGDATLAANGALTIANDAVTNDKLANISRGSVKVGGTDNAPTDLDAKTSGQILVGDGTDVVSVAVGGDATLAADGTLTIANDAITNDKLANITRGSVKVGGASDAPTDLDAKTSGNILVGDGTDVKSVAVSGDVSLAADGSVTISNNVVDDDNVANLSTEGIPILIVKDLTGTTPISIYSNNAPYKMVIADVWVVCTGTNTNGTAKLTDGTNDITDAMTMDTDKAVTHASTIDDAYYTISANGSLSVTKNADADSGIIYILAYRSS